jgi:hypothetical protein
MNYTFKIMGLALPIMDKLGKLASTYIYVSGLVHQLKYILVYQVRYAYR